MQSIEPGATTAQDVQRRLSYGRGGAGNIRSTEAMKAFAEKLTQAESEGENSWTRRASTFSLASSGSRSGSIIDKLFNRRASKSDESTVPPLTEEPASSP